MSQNVELSRTFGIEKRYIQIFISFSGLVNTGILYASLSTALVSMTNPDDGSYYGASAAFPVNYSVVEKGQLLAMGSYGSTIGTIPAGWLANVYKRVLLMYSMVGIVCGALTIFMPYVAASYHINAVCSIRAIQGVIMSLAIPCTFAHTSRWVNRQEKEKFSWIWSGLGVGSLISVGTSGVISRWAGGWPSIYYFTGGASIAWGVMCCIWGVDCPDDHPTISIEEKDFIKSNIPPLRKMSVNWKKMLTAGPFWAIIITTACDNWVTITTTSLIPTYFDGVTELSLEQVGLVSIVPYLSFVISCFIFAFVADHLTGVLSTNVARKMWTTIGLWGPAIAFLVLYCLNFNATLSVVCIALAFSTNAAKQPGLTTNHYDVAPNLLGILSGITTFVSDLVSISGPLLMGYMVRDEHDPQQWSNLFGVVSLVSVLGGINFLLLGKTEEQPWEKNDRTLATNPKKLDSASSKLPST